jgi:hypothetical protein
MEVYVLNLVSFFNVFFVMVRRQLHPEVRIKSNPTKIVLNSYNPTEALKLCLSIHISLTKLYTSEILFLFMHETNTQDRFCDGT